MLEIKINNVDEAARGRARTKWDLVAKPLHSLGLMEDMVSQIAAVQRTENVDIGKRCALVFCGDHGVVAEGVTQSGSEVTGFVARSVAEGTANINLMSKAAKADVFAVDMGMLTEIDHPNMICRKQKRGTDNMAVGPAMTYAQAENAVQSGIDLVGEMKSKGYKIMAIGEMGIGNTTASSAVAAALLGVDSDLLTGRGAGLNDAGLLRKRAIIKQALSVNKPDPRDAVDVLSKVGGFELCGMAGACIGGMVHGVPIILDGVISAASALAAVRVCPECAEYLLASHVSKEPAGQMLLEAIGKRAVINGELALGEGTGAVLLLPMLDMVLNVYNGTHTFDDLGMDAYTQQEGK